ncbi:type ISP restriction/modification enzyme [Mesorhizobium sp. M4B.F.Ca.ET.017.02.2.1]|nr:type ISP restriction/modification enzyme [Mesorhizobium sp. M4B.F.Ca.ET.017.02.2.1]
MPNKMPAFFKHGRNQSIFFNDPGARAPFSPLATDVPAEFHLAASSDGFQCLPRYRYTSSGERVDNITDWALKEFQKAYGRDGQGTPTSPLEKESDGSRKAVLALTKDDIFRYVYGVLHDPVYRENYALNLKREFPRIPFYPDFWRWAEWGKRLMDLHIGYETVEPWPLERLDTPDEKARAADLAPKALLKADHDNGIIRVDTETHLSGIPKEAWDYRLGNRSSLDWILDQYKEKTPKDPTIREKFNTFRFADHKENVVDLLAKVTRVSVETVAITEAMKGARR